MLSELGSQIGEPYVKHLDGEIWELRPIRFAALFPKENAKKLPKRD